MDTGFITGKNYQRSKKDWKNNNTQDTVKK
jgi:hypothetical protein